MAYTTNSFTYAGGAQTFTLSFALGYLEEDDITAYVTTELDSGGEQIYRTFTFDSEFVLRITEDLDVDDVVVVERTVSKSVLEVDFETGGALTGRNMNIEFKHVFMSMQEILDGRWNGIDFVALTARAEAAAAAAAVSAASIDPAELIRRDGTIPFTAKILGVAPTADLHLATKKYVDDQVGGGAVMLLDGSQQMTGAMLLKAATDPTLDDHAARKKYVDDEITSGVSTYAPLASPTLTGVPLAPTAAPGTNNTQIATTAYADAAAGVGMFLISDTTPSSDTDIEFTGLSAYFHIWISIEGVDCTSNINLSFSDDAGSTYETSNTEWTVTDGGDGGGTVTQIELVSSSTGAEGLIEVSGFNAVAKGRCRCDAGHAATPEGNVYVRFGVCHTETAYDQIKLSVGSGVMNTGSIKLFGIKG